MSLVAWDNFINAENEDDAALHMKALSAAYNRIKFSNKDYPQLYGGYAGICAVIHSYRGGFEVTKYDQGLYEYAFQKIVGGSTSAPLKTIAVAWRQENRQE